VIADRDKRLRRDWGNHPARPVYYGFWPRLVDRWCGKRDGKRGLPGMPESGGSAGRFVAHTPKLDQLRAARNDAVERERLYGMADAARYEESLTAARGEAEAAERALERFEMQITALGEQPAEAALATRRAGEAHSDEHVVRHRRQGEHAAKLAPLVAGNRAAIEQRAQALLDIRRLDHVIAERLSVSRARGRRLHEHTRRRSANYWYWLIRKHPQAAAVMQALDPIDPDLPNWLIDPEEGELS
jgi:hypothetical protein